MSFSILKSIFYFHYVANTYHRKSMTLYLRKLKSPASRMFCVKFGWNWHKCSGKLYYILLSSPVGKLFSPFFYKELESAKNVILWLWIYWMEVNTKLTKFLLKLAKWSWNKLQSIQTDGRYGLLLGSSCLRIPC